MSSKTKSNKKSWNIVRNQINISINPKTIIEYKNHENVIFRKSKNLLCPLAFLLNLPLLEEWRILEESPMDLMSMLLQPPTIWLLTLQKSGNHDFCHRQWKLNLLKANLC